MTTLRLGHSLEALRPTLHNGPGWRVAVWVQGCVHRCTDNCLSPHLLDPSAGTGYAICDVQQAIRRVVSLAPMRIEGVTVLGGEPFEQAAALAELLAPLRAAELSSMVYSGHTIQWLKLSNESGVAALLNQTDVLVDGPYLPRLYSETAAWRGSTNQRLLCLTERYTPAALDTAFAKQGKGFSIQIEGNRVAVSGLQTPTGTAAITRVLGLPVLDDS